MGGQLMNHGHPPRLPGCSVLPPMNPRPATANNSPKDKPKKRATGDRFATINSFVDCSLAELSRSEALTWFVKVSWTGDLGVESLPSLASSFNTSEGSALTVRAVGAPRTARGWNVYVGTSDDQVERQNTGLLALGSTWQMPAGAPAAGIRPGTGQVPDQYLRRSTVVFRG